VTPSQPGAAQPLHRHTGVAAHRRSRDGVTLLITEAVADARFAREQYDLTLSPAHLSILVTEEGLGPR
jgi:hypothetical protein